MVHMHVLKRRMIDVQVELLHCGIIEVYVWLRDFSMNWHNVENFELTDKFEKFSLKVSHEKREQL